MWVKRNMSWIGLWLMCDEQAIETSKMTIDASTNKSCMCKESSYSHKCFFLQRVPCFTRGSRLIIWNESKKRVTIDARGHFQVKIGKVTDTSFSNSVKENALHMFVGDCGEIHPVYRAVQGGSLSSRPIFMRGWYFRWTREFSLTKTEMKNPRPPKSRNFDRRTLRKRNSSISWKKLDLKEASLSS